MHSDPIRDTRPARLSNASARAEPLKMALASRKHCVELGSCPPTWTAGLTASEASVPTDIQNGLGNQQPGPAGPSGGCWPRGPGYLTTVKTVAKVAEGQRGQAITAG